MLKKSIISIFLLFFFVPVTQNRSHSFGPSLSYKDPNLIRKEESYNDVQTNQNWWNEHYARKNKLKNNAGEFFADLKYNKKFSTIHGMPNKYAYTSQAKVPVKDETKSTVEDSFHQKQHQDFYLQNQQHITNSVSGGGYDYNVDQKFSYSPRFDNSDGKRFMTKVFHSSDKSLSYKNNDYFRAKEYKPGNRRVDETMYKLYISRKAKSKYHPGSSRVNTNANPDDLFGRAMKKKDSDEFPSVFDSPRRHALFKKRKEAKMLAQKEKELQKQKKVITSTSKSADHV